MDMSKIKPTPIKNANVKPSSIVLKAFVGLLIAMLVLGVFAFLFADSNLETTQLFSRLEGTLGVVSGALLLNLFNCKTLEGKEKLSKIFGWIGVGASVVAVFMNTLLIWEIVPYLETTNAYRIIGDSSSLLSGFAKASFVAYTSTLCSTFIGWTMNLEEVGGVIKALKITALSCIAFCWAFYVFLIFRSVYDETILRLAGVSGIMVLGAIVSMLSAYLIIRAHKKKQVEALLLQQSGLQNQAAPVAQAATQVSQAPAQATVAPVDSVTETPTDPVVETPAPETSAPAPAPVTEAPTPETPAAPAVGAPAATPEAEAEVQTVEDETLINESFGQNQDNTPSV